jgi:hypothetical protein
MLTRESLHNGSLLSDEMRETIIKVIDATDMILGCFRKMCRCFDRDQIGN